MLKDLSFLKLFKDYRKKIKNNILFVSLPVFLKVFEAQSHRVVSDRKFLDLTGTQPAFVGAYQHFYKLKETPLSNKNISEHSRLSHFTINKHSSTYNINVLKGKFEN